MDFVFACWNLLLFKAEKKKLKTFLQGNAMAANEFTLRMWLN